MARRPENHLGYVDFLTNIFIAMFLLFVIALISVTATKAINEGINIKAEFIASLEWDDKIDADIDLWMQDPNGDVVNFRFREAGMMHLDRDSRGTLNNLIKLPDGKILQSDDREIITLRGIIPGEYVINAHAYKVKYGNVTLSSGEYLETPLVLKFKLEKINPRVVLVHKKEVEINKSWEEVTIIRFTLDNTGNVTNVNSDPKSLIGN